MGAGLPAIRAGSHARPTATVGLLKEGKKFEDSSTGNGAVDAVIKAIERITKRKGTLKGYSVNAASEGKDALGEVTVHVDFGPAPSPSWAREHPRTSLKPPPGPT